MFRPIAKSLGRQLIFKRRLPPEFANTPMFVTPDAALQFWRWNLSKVDPFLLSMVRELIRPGMMVWDIGANVGLFSFAAASLGAQVLAVEADIRLADLMQRSVALNKLPVTIVPAAVSDHPGISKLYISEDGRASNSLKGSGHFQTAVTITLDSLLNHFPPPQVLKIDIEGMEYPALSAAGKVLDSRPVIFCEVTSDHHAMAKLLKNANYEFFAARATDRVPLQRPSRDTLAIPSKQ